MGHALLSEKPPLGAKVSTPKLSARERAATRWFHREKTEVKLRCASGETLPGQYFDQESNLHYNYFRDYNPSIGRYMQSDPIGLSAGLNIYGYVSQNPLRAVDLFGLKEFILFVSSAQASYRYISGEFGILVLVDPCTLDTCAFSFAGAGLGLGFGAAVSGEVGNIDIPSGQCNQVTGFGLGISGFLAAAKGVAGSLVGNGGGGVLTSASPLIGGAVGPATGGGGGVSGQGTYTWPIASNEGSVPQWITDSISKLHPNCGDC